MLFKYEYQIQFIMRHTIIICALSITSFQLSAGSNDYISAMQSSLMRYDSCQTAEDYRDLANRFAIIAQATEDSWYPSYYQVHCLILGNFNSREDEATRDQWLDVAQEVLDELKEQAPGEVEIQVLQGMLHTSRLVIDAPNRGQRYGALSAQALGMAIGMDPMNPRARYMMLSNERGTAAFFGKDLTPYCEQARELLNEWDDGQVNENPFHPSWGKAQTEAIANSCKSK